MKIILNNNNYELLHNYKDAFDEEEVKEKFTEYFNDYDYILGDIAYNKLRLKGFYNENNPKVNKINNYKNIDNYLNKTVDLRIIVHNDEEIYINIYLLELIKNYKNIKYLNNSFYLNINDLKKEDVYSLIESSNIIYGEELSSIKSHWHNLT